MKTTIQDRKVLQGIRPLDLIGYLRSAGWTREAEWGEKAAVWVKPEVRDADVLLPLVTGAGDFALRMSEVLLTLERIEGRSQEEILHDVLTVSADILRIRCNAGEAGDGSVPLEVGAELIEQAQQLIAAAASSAVQPKAYWARKKPAQATDYLKQVKLGQTERGSFVITVHSPVPPEMRTGMETELPFERKVMQTLTGAVDTARTATRQAMESGDFAPFHEGVKAGLSANLCEALARMGEVAGEGGLGLRVTWSRGRAAAAGPVWQGQMESQFVPVLKEAARLFKWTEIDEELELCGFVEKLDRAPDAQFGTVTIGAWLEAGVRRVKLELGDEEYRVATQAHETRKPIQCSGVLTRPGKSLVLSRPREFRIVEEE